MSVTTRFTGTLAFGASHELPNHPTCGRLHGHQYTVSFTFENTPVRDNFGYPMTMQQFNDACDIILELRGRHLNDMLPASIPSVSGISGYLLERLRILGVVRVEVHESDTDVKGTAINVAG